MFKEILLGLILSIDGTKIILSPKLSKKIRNMVEVEKLSSDTSGSPTATLNQWVTFDAGISPERFT